MPEAPEGGYPVADLSGPDGPGLPPARVASFDEPDESDEPEAPGGPDGRGEPAGRLTGEPGDDGPGGPGPADATEPADATGGAGGTEGTRDPQSVRAVRVAEPWPELLAEGPPAGPGGADDDRPRRVRVASFDPGGAGEPGGPETQDAPETPENPENPEIPARSARPRRGGAGSGAPEHAAPERTAPERAAPERATVGTDPEPRGHPARRRGRGRRRGSSGSGAEQGTAEGAGTPAAPADPADERARAKEICLRLLTDRARSVQELRDALARKEVPADVADAVLDRFDEVGLVDDAAFADQWVRSRHRHRGLGRRAIAVELRRKGVDAETAAEALTGIDDDAERARAAELVDRRLRSLPTGSPDQRRATARKLVGMLARKGYGPGVAYGVVTERIAAAGADPDEFGEAPPEE